MPAFAVLLLFLGLGHPQASTSTALVGTWNATMHIGKAESHFQFVVTRDAQGTLAGYYVGVDSEKQVTLTVSGTSVQWSLDMGADSPKLQFQGTLKDSGDEIDGKLGMGSETYPTELTKAAPAAH